MNIFTKANLAAWHIGKQIKRGAKKIVNLSLTDPKAWDRSLWNLYGAQSQSGETVNEETALTYSAFWNAITLIAGPLGSLPLHLMRLQGKNKQYATKNSLYDVLHTKFNPYMTAMAGRECLAAHALTWGNGYAEIVRNGYGRIIELWPIAPNRVMPKMDQGELVYEVRLPDGQMKIFKRDKILHVPGIGFDGFSGYSVVAMARKSIGLGMAMETFGSRFFGHGTHPTGVVTHPNQIKDIGTMRKALNTTYAGLDKSHRLMLLEEGMTYKEIGIPPEDAQFLESREFQITDMARWMNLPVHKLKEMSKSSFNNIESENASYVVDSLLPWFVRFEQSYNMQLLSAREIKEGHYFKHNFEGLLRANAKDRAEFYKIMVGNGFMTPNEVRAKEDMNPSADPLMDEHWMPTGLIPVSKFDDYLSKNQGDTVKPQPEEKENPDEVVEKASKLIHLIPERTNN